jgi:uncharacterized repeat protein (TIGR03803 family)
MRRLPLHLLFLAFGIAASIASAQSDESDAGGVKFATLHSFSGTDGDTPQAGLVQATNGDLYGTAALAGPNGWGTIFKITPNGALTTLYNFCSQSGCADGAHPAAKLVQATNGDLYGTTEFGGIANPSCYLGTCGTIFKITPSGAFTTVYSFCAQAGCYDGDGPSPFIQAANGDLFGTASGGIANPTCGGTCGTIFKITPGGAFATIYSFCSQPGCSDGAGPETLLQASNGDLFGTTGAGGLSNASCSDGCGTIFKITPSGTLTTLYSFCSRPNCSDGVGPYRALAQAANGDLYGTTLGGGIASDYCFSTCGTIFKITLSGTLTTLYSFCSDQGEFGCLDGDYPETGLVRAASGNLYGTTLQGGAKGGGTIFKITPSGTFSTLYNFCSATNCTDGRIPEGLTQATNGIFYGTTENGGTNGVGNIFALSTGQAPFVETRPTVGVAGETVTILGYELTGATSVAFNDTPAAFTVDGATAITTTVPAGATTGKVQVITPGGTLSSNVSFEVAP